MKAVRVHGPGDVRLDKVETPVAGPADVVVRVAASGICGSDFTYVADRSAKVLVAFPL